MSDYYSIKTNCLRRRQLWEDPEFRAEQKSIFFKRVSWMPNFYRVVWKRPGDITYWPQFTIDGASKFDADQGLTGNCWFLAAISVVATKPELLDDVVPLDQSFDRDYAGIFRFNFWQYGRWEEVIVDDKLPTLDGQLVFCKNRDERREFWAALLEKAYAKIHGSYQALDAGWSIDGLVDLTGGIGETMDMKDYKNDRNYLLLVLQYIHRMNSLLCGAIWPKSHRQMEQVLPNGLVAGHAYSINSIVEFEHYGQRVVLIRLLNPWGHQEWNGDWSDRSRQWRSIPSRTRQELKLEPKDDGEFWMPFDEFLNNFDQVQICHLGPETALAGKRNWSVLTYHGEWIKGLNAGGPGLPPHEEKYWTNPQFFVTLRDTNRWDGVDRCIMVVSLMQKYQRRKRTETQSLRHLDTPIAFDLHRFRGRVPKDLEFQQFDFRQLERIGNVQFLDSRERTERFELDPGTYCIIPKTFHPDEEAEFLLRIATE